MHQEKPLKEALAPILRILADLGGKFSFMDESGNQFILASKEAFDQESQLPVQEHQLELSQVNHEMGMPEKRVDGSIADDVIERVNRDIAVTFASQQDTLDDIDELVEFDANGSKDSSFYTRPTPPPVTRIRFESVRGDLAPDLQD